MKTLTYVLLGILILTAIIIIYFKKKSTFLTIKEELQQIPKVIHKVYIQNSGEQAKFPLEPKELQKAHDSWKQMNPEYEIKYYSMNDCREYLKKHFEDSDFLQAFDCLNAYACKCDFFRYCVLYAEGGWYSDWKQVCLKKNVLNELDLYKQDNIVLCWDHGNDLHQNGRYIINGFIGTIKNSLFLKECINEIINNVKYKYYGKDSLDETGPGLLGRIYKQNEFHNLKIYLIFKNNKINNLNKKQIILNKCNNCGLNQDWTNGNNYNEVWNKRESYKDFKIKDTIPKIIHKTGPENSNNLSLELKNLFEKTIKNNPDYKIKYYDDNDCYNLIKNNFEPDVLCAYETLIPTAYKADLFRYCVLYLYGGIYSDLTQSFLVPLNSIIDFKTDTLILCEDRLLNKINKKCIQINFICSISKHKVFMTAIKKIIKNCKNNYYGDTLFCSTGPCLFKNSLNNIDTNYIIKLKQINSNTIVDINNNKVISMYSKNHHKNLYSKNKIHYGILWEKKNVYNNLPKIVHLIYIPWEKDGKTLKTDELDFNHDFYYKMKKNNPDWDVILWTYTKLKNFMEKNYIQYWNILNNKIKIKVQIIDFCRLLLVYHFGGIYWQYESIQLNNLNICIPPKNKNITLFIETILNNKQITESKLEPIRKGKPEEKIRISHGCFYSNIKNDFIYYCINKSIYNLHNLELKKDYDILYIGSNAMISEAYDEYKGKNLVNLLKTDNIIQFTSYGSWRNKDL